MDPTTAATAAPAEQTAKAELMAKLVYVLYLASLVVGVTSLVGVVIAYVYQGDAPEGLRTHFRLQIRTFWIGLLYGIVGALLSLAGIGIVLLVFVAVWLIVRCVKGLRYVGRREPYPNEGTWLW
jgi:uncharacterized membrane protein